MSATPVTYPSKAFNRRANIRARAVWRTYTRITGEWVDSPASFLASSYTSLLLTGFFLWNLLTRSAHFWPNVYNVLISGWAALLFATLSLAQTKVIHRTIGVPVVGIFLAGGSAFIYQDAKNVTVRLLNEQFPFAVSQLSEAIDSGTRIAFALEIAGFGTLAVVICYFVLVMQTAMSRRKRYRDGSNWFLAAAAGALASLLLVGSFSFVAFDSFGMKVLFIRAAYEWDFTSHFQCQKAPAGAKVMLSKMSDTVGYAVKLDFPDRPFFRMKESDGDLARSMPASGVSYRVVSCNTP